MDAEAWIIAQLEPMPPDASGELVMDGPSGLNVRVEATWWEAESPEAACRGVTVEVSIGRGPAGSFAYAVAENGSLGFLDRLEPEQSARIVDALQGNPAARLVPRAWR